MSEGSAALPAAFLQKHDPLVPVTVDLMMQFISSASPGARLEKFQVSEIAKYYSLFDFALPLRCPNTAPGCRDSPGSQIYPRSTCPSVVLSRCLSPYACYFPKAPAGSPYPVSLTSNPLVAQP